MTQATPVGWDAIQIWIVTAPNVVTSWECARNSRWRRTTEWNLELSATEFSSWTVHRDQPASMPSRLRLDFPEQWIISFLPCTGHPCLLHAPNFWSTHVFNLHMKCMFSKLLESFGICKQQTSLRHKIFTCGFEIWLMSPDRISCHLITFCGEAHVVRKCTCYADHILGNAHVKKMHHFQHKVTRSQPVKGSPSGIVSSKALMLAPSSLTSSAWKLVGRLTQQNMY